MTSGALVSGLPRSLPPLPPGPAPTCVPCVEGRQHAAPHSSTFLPTKAPLQTLHMDVWGPARVRGHGHERYFLLVVDDYSRYTIVFPFRRIGEVSEVLIDWLRGARRQLSESFSSDLPVLRLHSDRGGEFSSDLLWAFCRSEGIRQTFTLPASPQKNGIAERRIGMVMDVARVDPAEPVEVAVDLGAARGAEPAGAGTGGAEPGGADSGGAASWGAEPACAESGGSPGVPLRREPLSPQWLCEWYARRCGRATSATGAGAPGPGGVGTGGTGAAGATAGAAAGARATGGATSAGATGGAAGAGAAGGAAGAGAAGGAARAGAPGGAAGAGAARAAGGGTGAVSAVFGGAAQPRPYYVLLLQQVLGLPPSPGPPPPLLSLPPVQSQSPLPPSSPLPGPSPYSRPTRGLTERREPESRPMSPRVALPSPPLSSLPDGPDPEGDSLRAASPTVTRFLASAVSDPLFESTAASALVAELVDFAAAYRLDCATCLVAESASVCPPSVGGECALGTDVLEDRKKEFECFAVAVPHLVSMLLAPEGDPDAPDIPTPRSYVEAIEGPYSSQWQAAMDAKMASWKSTGTYVDDVPPPGANIVSGMWIFRVKRPPGFPPVFKARYVARGFNQRQGVDFF
ncbi:unnamed protein product [Closterium sp. NIES-53]